MGQVREQDSQHRVAKGYAPPRARLQTPGDQKESSGDEDQTKACTSDEYPARGIGARWAPMHKHQLDGIPQGRGRRGQAKQQEEGGDGGLQSKRREAKPAQGKGVNGRRIWDAHDESGYFRGDIWTLGARYRFGDPNLGSGREIVKALVIWMSRRVPGGTPRQGFVPRGASRKDGPPHIRKQGRSTASLCQSAPRFLRTRTWRSVLPYGYPGFIPALRNFSGLSLRPCCIRRPAISRRPRSCRRPLRISR